MSVNSKKLRLEQLKVWGAIITPAIAICALGLSWYSMHRSNEVALLLVQKQETTIQEQDYQQNLLNRTEKFKTAMRDLRYANSEYFWICANKTTTKNLRESLKKANAERKKYLQQ